MGFLQEQYQLEFRREKIRRVLLSFLVLANIAVLTGFVFMLPTYFSLVFSKDEVLRLLKTSEEVFAAKELGDLEKKLNDANQLIDNFSRNEKRRYAISPILAKVLKNTPRGVALRSIILARNDAAFELRIEGQADFRETFINYTDRLSKIGEFASVHSPVANLLKENDASFVLNIKINPETYRYVK